MAVEDSLIAFQEFVSSNFGIPAEWFQFPLIIFYFIIPLVSLIFMWYILLSRRIRIFRNSFVNFMLALLIAVINSSLIAVLSPTFAIAIGLGGTTFFWRRFSLLTIIISFLVASIVFFLYPNLVSLVQSLVQA